MASYLEEGKNRFPADDTPPLPAFASAFPCFYKHPQQIDRSTDPFTVNAITGFLPTHLPIKDLPEVFRQLQKIVEQMPVLKLDGTAGLLARYELGPLIDDGMALTDLTENISDLIVPGTDKHDLHIVTALFRD